ncbi:MAG TPA: hypothetical protein VNK46_15485 [Nitrospiraceae bacterium]|jgi:hypothetical protein|nr:hypothetical protein [Nitrospiraceae bacterium]
MRPRRKGEAVTAWRICALWIVIAVTTVTIPAWGRGGIDFSGTVLSVDPEAGKFAVKKADGGTRFTFVANDKTAFEGRGRKDLRDLKKGDQVVVTYQVSGSHYIALKVIVKER